MPDLSGREPSSPTTSRRSPRTRSNRASRTAPTAGTLARSAHVRLHRRGRRLRRRADPLPNQRRRAAVLRRPVRLRRHGDHTLEYRAIDGAGNAEDFKSVALQGRPSRAVDDRALDRPSPLRHRRLVRRPGHRDARGERRHWLRRSRHERAGSTAAPGPDTAPGRRRGGGHAPLRVPVRRRRRERRDAARRADQGRPDRPATTALVDGAAPRRPRRRRACPSSRTDGDGSGATATEYRVGDGAWTRYAGAFDLTALGTHRIDFRSRDLVGNVENYRTLWLELTAPPARSGEPPTAPAPRPFAALAPVAARHATLAALRGGGLAVRVSCQGVRARPLTLSVTPRDRAAARVARDGPRRPVRALRVPGPRDGEAAAGADVRRALKGARRACGHVAARDARGRGDRRGRCSARRAARRMRRAGDRPEPLRDDRGEAMTGGGIAMPRTDRRRPGAARARLTLRCSPASRSASRSPSPEPPPRRRRTPGQRARVPRPEDETTGPGVEALEALGAAGVTVEATGDPEARSPTRRRRLARSSSSTPPATCSTTRRRPPSASSSRPAAASSPSAAPRSPSRAPSSSTA